MQTADKVIELLVLLQQQTDLSAEFFLLCLEVCRTVYMYMLTSSFYMAFMNNVGIMIVAVA